MFLQSCLLVGGVQPMQAEEDGETIASLVFAGEIYNFIELREELIGLGHAFRTRSDTEVILRGYLQWGAGVVDRLNGMFSFAIWDLRREELLLVRDRMGVKPLFYYPTVDGVVFGSEPKAILAHPDVPCRVDLDGLREVLVLVKNPERTPYAGMHEVRPGQIVRVSRAGLEKRRYWQLIAREHEHDLDRTVEVVSDLLADIVHRQIITDVPLCALLSGGLDSSTITALADRAIREKQGGHIRSFSVDFVSHGTDFVPNAFHRESDAPYVRDFVRHVGSDHTEVVLDSRELTDSRLNAAVLRACDFPVNASGDMFTSLYRLCEAIKAHSTVALSGESADEVFGGYSWFHDPEIVARDDFPWLAALRSLNAWRVLDPGLLEQLQLPEFQADSYRQALTEVPVLESDSPVERRMRELSHLHLTRFVQFLLDRKDRMSMAVGLEVRVPFCDHRLVEYVFNVPWSMKTFDGREKSVLRAAARPLLPESIVKRVKSPYPSTQDPSYEAALREAVAAIANDPGDPAAHLFDRAAVEQVLDRSLGNVSVLSERTDLERVRSLSTWFKEYDVALAA
ncbi:MAG: asparagine synthase (glutamine-hydrolyzing) [Acetobacteraceae bacterium]|nr:asparagine synthase (glutamine-hydrolyzing) [Acetobacteraceae bacterium]